MTLYEEDLAFVQAAAYGVFATSAAPELIALLRKARTPVRRVIDVGCGAGVTTRALVDAGFSVLAVEPSPALLAIARAAVSEATFVNDSIYAAAIELGSADAILAVGEALTYHAPEVDAEARMARFFERAASVLPEGGLLIFDLICAGDPPLDVKGWRHDDDWAILFRTREDRSANRLTRAIETFRKCTTDGGNGDFYRRAREVHHVRIFDAVTISESLISAGFDVEIATAYGSYALAPRRKAFIASRTSKRQ